MTYESFDHISNTASNHATNKTASINDEFTVGTFIDKFGKKREKSRKVSLFQTSFAYVFFIS